MKDRVASKIIQEGFESGKLKKGGLITEGTAGSTGVSLAMISASMGCRCFIAMPDDAAIEKVNMLEVGSIAICYNAFASFQAYGAVIVKITYLYEFKSE